MAKPTAGREYTIVTGDTLSGIAAAAYGNPNDWRRIWEANQFRLRSNDPDLIYPGEVVLIPGRDPAELADPKAEPPQVDLPGREPDDLTLIIDGEEIPLETGRVFMAADTGARGFTGSVSWDPSGPLTRILRPFGYQDAEVYLGGVRVLTGSLYGVVNDFSSDGYAKDIEVWSRTADVLDSTLKPPYEANKATLKDRAEKLCSPLGIGVIYSGDDEIFERVKADPTDTIFKHLQGLAEQRGLLVSCSALGELMFLRADLAGNVGSLIEGVPPFVNIKAKFNGRARFNVYKAIGQSPKKSSKSAVAKDNVVPKSRFLTFSADDATVGNIQQAADWKRSKQLADTLSIPLPVTTWYAPNGALWEPNTLVTVVSHALGAPDGFDFLIRSVNFTFEGNKIGATLQLVPPQVFTGGDLAEPWLEV